MNLPDLPESAAAIGANPEPSPASSDTWGAGLNSGMQWGAGPTTVNVYVAGLAGDEAVVHGGQSITAQGSVSAQEIAAMNEAMAMIEAVCNVTFNAVGTQADADVIWACVDNVDGFGALGWANFPGGAYSSTHGAFQSVIAINQDAYAGTSLAAGSFDFITYIHELGHALGLAHPHDDAGTSTVFPGVSAAFGDTGDFDLNQGIYTTMSYNDGWQTAPHLASYSNEFGWQGAPMALDIATLQLMYGANMATNSGDTVYTLPDSNGAGTYYAAIWDGGGTDEIVGALTVRNTIDLRAATLLDELGGGGFVSYAAGVHGGFTIANGVTIENARGGNLDDVIRGNAAANWIDGALGDDDISGGAGDDTLLGAAGADTLLGGGGADMLFGDLDDDTLAGGAGADTLVGGAGADTLNGGANNDVVEGGAGADVIVGAAGNDSLSGEAGGDTFSFDSAFGDDTIASGDAAETGNVIAFGSAVTEAMISTALAANDNDLLITVSGGSVVGTILLVGWSTAQDGGGGFGTLSWGGGGGGSLDLTSLSFAPPSPPAPTPTPIVGTSGNNSLYGTAADDLIFTSRGSDRAFGGDGNDTILGEGGNDTLMGGDGNDILDGGRDTDKVYGNDGDDEVHGGSGMDWLYGGAGNDNLSGDNARDRLFGGAGNDTLDGGGDRDRLWGDAGDDVLYGGAGRDNLFAGDGADALFGGASDDWLRGEAGADTLNGDRGNDTLSGGNGNDDLFSGEDNDWLYGNAGDDTLDGGTSSDVYGFAGAFGNDTVLTFDFADRLHLSAFRSVKGGSLNTNDLIFTDVGSNVVIEFDLDRNGVVDLRDLDGDGLVDPVSITLIDISASDLSNTDFFF